MFLTNSSSALLVAFPCILSYALPLELSFSLLFGDWDLLFCNEILFKIFSYVCIYFAQKSSRSGSRKTLIKKSCWIVYLTLYQIVYTTFLLLSMT